MPTEVITTQCYHCGDTCPSTPVLYADKNFCCEGCEMVYKLLHEHELGNTYYNLERQPGSKGITEGREGRWAYLEQPEVIEKLIDFSDGEITRLRLRIPQMHCTSCIWLLENLYHLHPGVRHSEVDFLRKQLTVSFQNDQLRLRELVALLAGIGYEPEIRLHDLNEDTQKRSVNSFLYPLGVAGFAFGNIMLLSFPEYFGAAAAFSHVFAYLNLLLALPVLFYSSRTFFLSAWNGLKQHQLNIDVPISLGIVVLFSRSLFEILTQSGAGYLDSFAGLVFFLLIGKWFQQKTYDRLAFDRDYTSYFPIAATRLTEQGQESVAVTQLQAGDRLHIRNQELIPADALLLSKSARIDYSFVTGESEPVPKSVGDRLYGGGRQEGNPIEIQLVKEVSRSYLTQLWNQEAFRKEGKATLQNLTDRIAKRFTIGVILVATLAGLYWWWANGVGMAVNVFTAVLIIACPCGIALTLPITLGNVLRIMGRNRLYLKNTGVIEQMARLRHLVFDKTGTLTQKDQTPAIIQEGTMAPDTLTRLVTLARTSTHPISQAITRMAPEVESGKMEDLVEIPGQGLQAVVDGHRLQLGNREYVLGREGKDIGESGPPPTPASRGQTFPVGDCPPLEGLVPGLTWELEGGNNLPIENGTWLKEDGVLVARFAWNPAFREGLGDTLHTLEETYDLHVLSGDTDRDRPSLAQMFSRQTPMHFRKSPQDKLEFISQLQAEGEAVMMIGDGLNDAGALQQSEVGVALTEDTAGFAPACDAILDAQSFARLPQLLQYSQKAVRLVQLGFILSLAYNLVGLSIAVQGWLTPVIAAILMPLSSLSVVIFGMASSWWLARRMGLE